MTGSSELVLLVELVAVVEHPLERLRRQVGRVRVHVAQEEEERLLARGQALQLRERHVVQVLRLVAAPLRPSEPQPAKSRYFWNPREAGLPLKPTQVVA